MEIMLLPQQQDFCAIIQLCKAWRADVGKQRESSQSNQSSIYNTLIPLTPNPKRRRQDFSSSSPFLPFCRESKLTEPVWSGSSWKKKKENKNGKVYKNWMHASFPEEKKWILRRQWVLDMGSSFPKASTQAKRSGLVPCCLLLCLHVTKLEGLWFMLWLWGSASFQPHKQILRL